MWNNLNKWEKAGLIIGSIECVAGFTVAMYAHIKCKKESEEIRRVDQIIEESNEILDELMKATGTTENKED